jgi:hypothetical protein
MSERRVHVRNDDGSEIDICWEPGAKFVLTVDDRSAIATSSAGTANAEPVSPESPGSTPPAISIKPV